MECEADALENGRPKVGFSATIRRSHDELRDNNYICNFLNTRERLKRPQQEGSSVDQKNLVRAGRGILANFRRQVVFNISNYDSLRSGPPGLLDFLILFTRYLIIRFIHCFSTNDHPFLCHLRHWGDHWGKTVNRLLPDGESSLFHVYSHLHHTYLSVLTLNNCLATRLEGLYTCRHTYKGGR